MMAISTHQRAFTPFSGYIGTPKMAHTRICDVMVIDGVAHRIHNVIVHRFQLGDVEDPDLYAAEPLIEWQNSEAGQWAMTHAIETPMWHRQHDHQSWGYSYAVSAQLKEVDYLFWQLKWSNLDKRSK
jgi:hypothetical protein